jgi:choline transport protein
VLSLGWICTISWQAGLAANCFFSAITIQTLFILNLPDYNFKRWHATLLLYGILSIAISFNTLLARKLPLAAGLLVFFHLLGVVIVIPVWILAPLRTGGSPLVDFNNPGWSTTGVAVMVGIFGTVAPLTGYDCSIHMCTLNFAFRRLILRHSS